MRKIIRITTVPASLKTLLKGQLKYVSQNGYDVIGVSSEGFELNEVAVNESVRVFALNMTRTISPIKDLISLLNLYILLIREKPDIVHTHTPKAGTIGMIASFLARIPVRLHTVAGLPLMEVNGAKRILLNIVEKITYFCATNIYPNSYGLKDIIVNSKFTSENKLKVIGNGSSNGIDTNHFDPSLFSDQERNSLKKTLNIEDKDFVFIFVGRLVGDKGVNELIESFNLLSIKNNKIKLLLVGPFEDDLDPLQVVTKQKIEKNNQIIFVGFQEDVRPYFAISNLLVFPSYREGFPNVVMQAGSMGLASIVTNINGSNEIIINNFNGLIIPKKDSNSLKKSMQFFLENETILFDFSKKSRNNIIEKYHCEIIWKLLVNEYNEYY